MMMMWTSLSYATAAEEMKATLQILIPMKDLTKHDEEDY
jgi:hypothetical protein